MTNRRLRRRAFSLVELLTVMFIIALLIGILIPSLHSARNSAKKASTKAAFAAIKVGLEQFKTENGKDFPQSNGYPPSFSHPPIADSTFGIQQGMEGRFPFLVDQYPVVFGAQWLPAMLMGVDGQGYVRRGSVPRKDNLRTEPWKWYLPDPIGPNSTLERGPLYIDPTGLRLIPTESIIGKRNDMLFPDWDRMKRMPVIVDAFDQPILYYTANANGRQTNMVAERRVRDNVYTGGTHEVGPPIYFHQDNHGFTGDEAEVGWDFGSGPHALQYAGHDLDATEISRVLDWSLKPGQPDYLEPTFARFIIDRAQLRTLEELRNAGQQVLPGTPLKPSNPDSYLLFSAGVDGRYGTPDDVTNFPLSVD